MNVQQVLLEHQSDVAQDFVIASLSGRRSKYNIKCKLQIYAVLDNFELGCSGDLDRNADSTAQQQEPWQSCCPQPL